MSTKEMNILVDSCRTTTTRSSQIQWRATLCLKTTIWGITFAPVTWNMDEWCMKQQHVVTNHSFCSSTVMLVGWNCGVNINPGLVDSESSIMSTGFLPMGLVCMYINNVADYSIYTVNNEGHTELHEVLPICLRSTGLNPVWAVTKYVTQQITACITN